MSRMRTGVGAVLVFTCLVQAWPRSALALKASPDKEAVVSGNNAFALDLYAELRGADGNLFFSPFSISTALAMTHAGARGRTETQMAEALHFDLDQQRLHPAFKGLVEDLTAAQEKRGYQLSVANALWGQKGYRFLPEFLRLVRANYSGGFNQVDFKGATEAARRTINRWVEEKTRDKIKDLIKPGILTPMTRLVLANAIYFKGDWASPFKKTRTRDAPFTLMSGDKIKAPMMHQTEEFGYMEGDGYQALELPYAGNDLSMIVFLPRKANGLPEFEKSATMKGLAKNRPRLRRRKVVVALPKFKMTSEFRLDDTLKSMGMGDAFSIRLADFSGMTGNKELYVGAVLHKAFVDVNEEGTEAAAATGVVMALKSMARPRPIPVFRADHPFVFLIRDNRSNSILFLGRVMNPKG